MKFKKLTALCLTALLFLSTGTGAFAAETNSTRSANAAYASADSDFTIENGVLTAYSGEDATVMIPGSVTAISGSAFRNSHSMTKILIPSSVTKIDSDAFDFCDMLTEFQVAANNTDFSNDSNGVLYNSTQKTLVRFPRGNASTSFKIPDSVTSIGNSAFFNSRYLTSVTMPSSVKVIDGFAFTRTKLSSITIPSSVTNVRKYAFSNIDVNNLSITIKAKNAAVDSTAFNGTSFSYVAFDGYESEWELSDWNSALDGKYSMLSYSTGITIHHQPQNSTVTEGESATLSLTASGDNLTYQWYYKKSGASSFTAWSGKTNAYETFTPDATWNGAQFYCLLTDNAGTTKKSNTVTLTVRTKLEITTQPQSKTINAGDAVSLSIKASGDRLAFQWYYRKSGATSFSEWSGKTNTTETFRPDTTWNGCQFYCIVNDGYGNSVSSNTVTLTVRTKLEITTQPQNKTVSPGNIVTLSVVASGDSLTYQWYYKKSDATAFSIWSNRTNPSETFTPDESWNGAKFYCVVKDGSGNSISSGTATLTVNPAISITQNPSDEIVVIGEEVTLSVTATGQELTYQWYYQKSGQTSFTAWSGKTSASERFAPDMSWDECRFYCVVKDGTGNTKTSSTAKITVYPQIVITQHPTNTTITEGSSVTFSLEATGKNLTYEWYYRKSGETSFSSFGKKTTPSISFTPDYSWNEALFYCIVEDGATRWRATDTVRLTIHKPLKIVRQPESAAVTEGDSITIDLDVEGEGLTYQWYYKKKGQSSFTKWEGKTQSYLIITPNATFDGRQLYCVVTDSNGLSIKSKTIALTVNNKLKITTQPMNNTIYLGDPLTLSLKASGDGLTYQWYFKKADQSSFSKWSNHTSDTETCVPDSTWNGIKLFCLIGDQYGNTVSSDTVTVTVRNKLKITTQPTNKIICLGDPLTLSLKASGDGLTYQWYYKKKGQTSFAAWNNRTAASETCTPNATWDGMQLYCIVKDSYSESIRSSTITVSVLSIQTQPSDKSIYLGSSVTLSFQATGSGLTYQWYYQKKGQSSFSKWNNHTAASETVKPPADWNGIQLYCLVKDGAGNSIRTKAVTVTVKNKLKITTQPQNQYIVLGKHVTVSLEATGDGLSYQWYYKKKGQSSFTAWNSRTAASESCTPNATWDGIQLYCIVKDSYSESIRSSTITVSVLSIATQPSDKSIYLGSSVTLSLQATGSGLTYQWYYQKKGQSSFSKWNNHTAASETVKPPADWNGIQLYCLVKDGAGNSIKSKTVTVTVKNKLKIITQPKNQYIVLGKPLTVSLEATGDGLTYQWYYKKKGQTSFTAWNSRTAASETCTPNATWDGMQLYCIVKDNYSESVQSGTVTVSVLSIQTQPVNQTIALGSSLTTSLKATGSGLTYQWYYQKKGQTSFNAWNNRTAASETVTPPASWNGIKLYCKVKDSAGHAITSNTVTVTVTGTIVITKQPDKQITIMEGDPVTLSLKANGMGLTYQWYCQKKGQTSFSQWNGRTHATETCNPGLSWNGMQLYCRITDSYGNTIDSDTVKVTVYPQIVITSQPYSQTVKLGKSLTLSLTAEGSGLTYQWYCKKAGQDSFVKWNGRIDATETVTPPADWDGIQLYCKVTDRNGNSIPSDTITITVV